jgi:hypothetical protein
MVASEYSFNCSTEEFYICDYLCDLTKTPKLISPVHRCPPYNRGTGDIRVGCAVEVLYAASGRATRAHEFDFVLHVTGQEPTLLALTPSMCKSPLLGITDRGLVRAWNLNVHRIAPADFIQVARFHLFDA